MQTFAFLTFKTCKCSDEFLNLQICINKIACNRDLQVTLDISFSAVSTQASKRASTFFSSEYSLESSCRDLQYLHSCAQLRLLKFVWMNIQRNRPEFAYFFCFALNSYHLDLFRFIKQQLLLLCLITMKCVCRSEFRDFFQMMEKNMDVCRNDCQLCLHLACLTCKPHVLSCTYMWNYMKLYLL